MAPLEDQTDFDANGWDALLGLKAIEEALSLTAIIFTLMQDAKQVSPPPRHFVFLSPFSKYVDNKKGKRKLIMDSKFQLRRQLAVFSERIFCLRA